VDPLRGESGVQLGVAVSGERTPCVDPLFGQPRLSTPVDCEVRSDLLSHSSGVSTGISIALQSAAAQSVPVLNSTARDSTAQHSTVGHSTARYRQVVMLVAVIIQTVQFP
jgi:hypothetical protein